MPYLEEQDLIGSWKRLPKKATRSLGEIPVQEVRFDETRRKFIEGEAVLKLLKGAMC